MRLRIPNNETTEIGGVQFIDGVSVGLVAPFQVNIFKSNFEGVQILQDDGVTVDEALEALELPIMPRGYYIEFGVDLPSPYLTHYDGTYDDAEALAIPVEQARQVANAKTSKYSREDLEAIADTKGIAGLRAIADEFGVKGRSVSDLIEAILAQA